MHKTINNLIQIQKEIKSNNLNSISKIIAVSKTFSMESISPLIEYGHVDFGENKVQEAIDKWTEVKKKNSIIKLHMIGKLQSNKVKFAVKFFDYIHAVDSEKIAKKIFDEQEKQKKQIKIFIQVNIGDEKQKSGVTKKMLPDLYSFCKSLKLNVVGLMCIPPLDMPAHAYFREMNILNRDLGLNELSMGMSSDYLDAVANSATYLRIGSNIFGKRI